MGQRSGNLLRARTLEVAPIKPRHTGDKKVDEILDGIYKKINQIANQLTHAAPLKGDGMLDVPRGHKTLVGPFVLNAKAETDDVESNYFGLGDGTCVLWYAPRRMQLTGLHVVTVGNTTATAGAEWVVFVDANKRLQMPVENGIDHASVTAPYSFPVNVRKDDTIQVALDMSYGSVDIIYQIAFLEVYF